MVSNKKYNQLLKEKEDWKDLACRIEQVGNMINRTNEDLLSELRHLYQLNSMLRAKTTVVEDEIVYKKQIVELLTASKYNPATTEFQQGANAAADYWITDTKYLEPVSMLTIKQVVEQILKDIDHISESLIKRAKVDNKQFTILLQNNLRKLYEVPNE